MIVFEVRYGLASAAGELRAKLKKKGEMIGPYDLLIARTALAKGLTLVTQNGEEFRRVAGLRVEDWTKS